MELVGKLFDVSFYYKDWYVVGVVEVWLVEIECEYVMVFVCWEEFEVVKNG